jgi:Bacterial membrane protein YfhO
MDAAGRERTTFLLLACLIVGFLFRDALLRGYVLGQAELLLQFPPWDSNAPLGWRPGNALLGDSPTVFYPFLVHARDAVSNGHMPLWNSSLASGMPFFAAFQSAVLSPFTILAYVFPLPHALTLVAAARLLVGGAGMFVFLRSNRLSLPAAAFGGIAYLLNPFSVVWLEHPLSAVAAWLPWLLLAVDRCARSSRGVDAALVAATTAAAVFSGHPETLFKVMLLVVPYAIYRAVGSSRPLRGVLAVAGGIALGALVGAVQIVPFLEYASQSRVLATRSTAVTPLFTIPPAGFVTAFVPDFFGNPTTRRYVLQGANYCEQQIYPGITTWILAAASLAVSRHRGRSLFFLAAAGVAALIMYGSSIATLAIALIPPLRVAALSRFGLLTITGVVIAAAFTVDRLLPDDEPLARGDRRRIGILATTAGIAIAALILMFVSAQYSFLEETRQLVRTTHSVTVALVLVAAAVGAVWGVPLLPRSWAASVLVGLIAADLFMFADGFHPLKPRETTFPPLAELEPIRNDPALFRVAGWDDTLIPNSALVYGVQDYRGYDGVGVRRYGELLDVAFRYNGSFHQLVSFSAPHLLDLLNIKYVLVPHDVAVPADRFALVKDGPTRIYRNDRVLARAFLADSFVTLQGNEARRALRDGKLDLRRTVVLEDSPPLEPALAAQNSDFDSAAVTHYDHHRVVIHTRATGPRLLVLSDTYYPGWTATMDGSDTPILPANFAFRAVSIPAGTHAVEFRYRPRSFRWGLSGTAVGLLVVASLALHRPGAGREKTAPVD